MSNKIYGIPVTTPFNPEKIAGAYYTPDVSQVDDATMKVSFTAGKPGMPEIPDQVITLPAGYTPQKNIDYFDGKDGYTPVKGVDYFDGQDGKDGYTPIKDVDYFDGKDGRDGQDGADGKTPVKGTDYWTAADKAEIVNDVLAALPAAEEVSV